MIRGTTPTFILTLEDDHIDLTTMDNVYVSFKQGTRLITKTGQDIIVSAQEVDVFFSQAESLSFNSGTIEVQLNFTFENGKRGCTNIVMVGVGQNLENKVLE